MAWSLKKATPDNFNNHEMETTPSTWLTSRSAGVLAHISSLPGRYGIGNLGPGSRGLLDMLGKAGVKYWQICPVGPTGYGNSPYQTFSGRAGNPYFIDLGELEAADLLDGRDLAPLSALPTDRVDYGRLYETFWIVLAKAYDRFLVSGKDEVDGLGSVSAFRKEQAGWLEPFAAFMALKSHFGGRAWTSWPLEFRMWTPEIFGGLPESVRLEASRTSGKESAKASAPSRIN